MYETFYSEHHMQYQRWQAVFLIATLAEANETSQALVDTRMSHIPCTSGESTKRLAKDTSTS